jgi:hypothetical protein
MWYVILASKEVKPGRMIAVRRFAEDLIPGDGPIIKYRRRRQSLIDAARKSA